MIEVNQEILVSNAVRTLYIDGEQFVSIVHDPRGSTTVSSNMHETCSHCGQSDCYFTCYDSQEALNCDSDVAEGLRVEVGERATFNTTIDGIEALLLTMAGEGVDMNDERIARAVFAAVEGAANNV